MNSTTSLGLRIVIISDTHSVAPSHQIPEGDVLIHAGDFSDIGHLEDMKKFHTFLDSFPHPYKIFIAGNHDIALHKSYYVRDMAPRAFHRKLFLSPNFNPEEYSNQCLAAVSAPSQGTGVMTYLCDSSYSIENSDGSIVNFFGSPWQPSFCDWAFNADIGPELAEKWKAIPNDVDVLITHGPPRGILDRNSDGFVCGCPDLRNEVLDRVKPRLHVFGHIHESYGKLFYCCLIAYVQS